MKSSMILKANDIIDGKYKITEFIGQGGMQQVYTARHILLSKEVAIKTPINPSALKRFKSTAVASARVNHPNVAKTLDYLEINNLSLLVEELIDGPDLKQGLLSRVRALDPSLVAKILHHLAKGVAASHQADVVHRDLKPNNVMITGGFSLDEIKITDFGIAKLVEDEMSSAEDGDLSRSTSSTVIGAWPYMAPEMILGYRDAGKPADVWSLAAMSYELMSGLKPFGPGAKALAAVLRSPIPVPARPAQLERKPQFEPLGDELYGLICSCLLADPSARPTAAQLAKRCESLCYSVSHRFNGRCNYIHPRGAMGQITIANGDKIFFNMDSVYGDRPEVESNVCFSAFPGQPLPRAHPVLVLKTGPAPES